MDQVLIPVGVAYSQVIEDFRAMIRHELHHATPVVASAGPLPDELLSIHETAAMLGVTVQSVHEWKRRGLLKFHKISSRTYFKRAEVVAALQSQQRSKK